MGTCAGRQWVKSVMQAALQKCASLSTESSRGKMDKTILVALIGAAATLIAALIGRSDFLDALLRPRWVSDLKGEWQSSWKESDGRGQVSERTEIIRITRMHGNRLDGRVESAHYQGKPCRIEGFFSGRFLLLMWYPAKEAEKKLIDDYGCYFFEKKADGGFEGESVGFFEHLGGVGRFEHTLRRVKSE
jgi:hypothetical protein